MVANCEVKMEDEKIEMSIDGDVLTYKKFNQIYRRRSAYISFDVRDLWLETYLSAPREWSPDDDVDGGRLDRKPDRVENGKWFYFDPPKKSVCLKGTAIARKCLIGIAALHRGPVNEVNVELNAYGSGTDVREWSAMIHGDYEQFEGPTLDLCAWLPEDFLLHIAQLLTAGQLRAMAFNTGFDSMWQKDEGTYCLQLDEDGGVPAAHGIASGFRLEGPSTPMQRVHPAHGFGGL